MPLPAHDPRPTGPCSNCYHRKHLHGRADHTGKCGVKGCRCDEYSGERCPNCGDPWEIHKVVPRYGVILCDGKPGWVCHCRTNLNRRGGRD